jgi:membrane-associated protease RseP (regulator of RpoE activity)
MVEKGTTNPVKSFCQGLGEFFEIKGVFRDEHNFLVKCRPLANSADPRGLIHREAAVCGLKAEIEDAGEDLIISLPRHHPGERLKRRIPWLNLVLFVATVMTTMFFGAMIDGYDPLHGADILHGLSFSAAILGILLCHEFGHYLVSRKHRVRVSLPYFIPAPTIIGTMGAVIKSRSPFRNRRQLLEVGVAGPIAGFVVTIIVIVIGLRNSHIVPATELQAGVYLGDSLLFSFLSDMVMGHIADECNVYLNSVAFAGWVGLLVTMLNLLPVGQLDGGHIGYALFGRAQQVIAKIVWVGLVVLGFFWPGWFVWAVLMLVLKTKHPPTLNDTIPLTRTHLALGIFSYIIFVICFIPVPFS